MNKNTAIALNAMKWVMLANKMHAESINTPEKKRAALDRTRAAQEEVRQKEMYAYIAPIISPQMLN